MSGALLTDFYQLAMAHAYFELDMHEVAVFELFVRRLPPTRRFLIAAGLARVLDYVEELRFTDADLEFLSTLGAFPDRFLDHLRTVRFTGSIDAMGEGTPCFADEPILRVTAPILEAQLLESRLLNIVHFQTLIASKAVRCVIAARGRRLIDFGMRRAHEGDAAIYAARAAYLAGFDATATVEAGERFGIPLTGTLAHSFIEAHDDEEEAFRRFVGIRPGATTLLIDTYDTRRAAARVASLARSLRAAGSQRRIQSVRIDSGDLAAEARGVRAILDAGDCPDVQIVLSGGLDELQIAALVSGGAPVDAFGVGTSLDVSSDAPALDIAYKLQAYAGKPRRKLSPGKVTWPGAKQVVRERGATGECLRDRIILADEVSEAEALLGPVVRNGRRVGSRAPLEALREHCRNALRSLPADVTDLRSGASAYPVARSQALEALAAGLG